MTKKLLLSSLVVFTALMVSNAAYTADLQAAKKEAAVKVEKSVLQSPHKDCLPPPDFTKSHHPEFKKGHPGMMMHPPFPSKAEMEAKKAEIDKRLNLTDEQKQKLEQNKEKDRAKIKPIMDNIHEKKAELHKIYSDDTLTQEQKDKKAKSVKKDLNKLRAQADNCRKENMKHFESVLTTEQKTEFAKIKTEQKAEMEKRRAEFEQKKKEFQKEFGKNPPAKPLPVPDLKK